MAANVDKRFKIPKTYWIGADPDEFLLNISSLPARYVMKPNHSSGRFLVVDTRNNVVDSDLISELFREWLRVDEETESLGHWGYRKARHLVFVEERVGLGLDAPIDIRVFTTQGEIVGAACTGSFPNGQKWTATYDGELQRRPSGYPGQLSLDAVTPLSDLSADTIKNLRCAIRAASEEFDQLRVDMYRVEDEFYFGEFTVYSSSGLVKYNDETDYRYGAAWKLSELTELVRNDLG